ncbi:GNPNAT1 [Cordylochernes scorpioides]|uniref:Glucosamine 6-phosphate N-acetyltransferase n=1 Tax=Cordylochernes scorpioides TaxID=51811 RepID=A0ABY6L5V9_9ARAC|nr:GNPNAT1 [Cordylochernes scorpioides]
MQEHSEDLYPDSILRILKEDGISAKKLQYDPDNQLLLRPLQLGDYDRGYLELLSQLTNVGEVSREEYTERFRSMQKCKDTYYILVIEDVSLGQVVASASLIVELKFIHNTGLKGKLEDVVVHQSHRGRKLGQLLVEAILVLAQDLGCYKVTLECKDAMIGFYQSVGFTKEPGNSTYMYKRYITD